MATRGKKKHITDRAAGKSTFDSLVKELKAEDYLIEMKIVSALFVVLLPAS